MDDEEAYQFAMIATKHFTDFMDENKLDLNQQLMIATIIVAKAMTRWAKDDQAFNMGVCFLSEFLKFYSDEKDVVIQ